MASDTTGTPGDTGEMPGYARPAAGLLAGTGLILIAVTAFLASRLR